MSGGSSKTPTQTTQKVEPWDAAKPYYTDLYAAAQKAYTATDKAPYTGELYAAPNATQQQALDQYKAAAGTVNTTPTATLTGYTPTTATGVGELNAEAQKLLSGGYLNAGANPYLQDAITAATTPIRNQLMRQILPALQDQSIAQGAFGGSGYGTAQGLATSDFTQQALDLAGKLSYSSYDAERNRMMNAGQLFGQAAGLQGAANDQGWSQVTNQANLGTYNAGVQNNNNSLSLLPAQLLDKAGSQQQTWDAQKIAAELQRYNINQAAPFAGLGEFAQILNGGGFNSTGTTTSGGNATGAGSFLQGAAGVAGLGSALFPQATSSAGNWLSSLFGGNAGASTQNATNAAFASLFGNGS
ncbi:hypothetical protein Kuura_019 [Caulobacter phage Kuura]|nr:hypothetical protein Kuura_019 [Caulobacter phage Kuura]